VNEIPVVRLIQVLGDKMCEIKLRVMRYEDDAVQGRSGAAVDFGGGTSNPSA